MPRHDQSGARSWEDEGWVLVLDDEGAHRGVTAGLLSVTDGLVGVRADDEDVADGEHMTLVAGAYGTGPDGLERPIPGPSCTYLGADHGHRASRWRLDMRTGVLRRESADGLRRSERFACLARPGLIVVRAFDPCPDATWADALGPPTVTSGLAAEWRWDTGTTGDCSWAEVSSDLSSIVTAADQRVVPSDEGSGVDRFVFVGRGGPGARDRACEVVAEAARLGVDALLREQRDEWRRRWADAAIEIDGDEETQGAVRFALFHLLSCAPGQGSTAVGARGLTGLAYAGHVFWDTDVFVLPALSAIHPDAARSVLRYRLDRLEAARENAAQRHLPGARFPWESAGSGHDVTPTSVQDLDGSTIPVRTGVMSEHIDADVAWGLHRHLEWTGDRELLGTGGSLLVLETARYWQGRIAVDGSGSAHIRSVIGPDEYHEAVDDDAFTNGMARWHLRWAAELASADGDADESRELLRLADALVDGFDPVDLRHEQFAGFSSLEPLLISEIAAPPVAADLLLGRDRVGRSQVVKQPDVLMLHHLLPDDMPRGSLGADLDHYLPRLAHGSSLSPAITASLIARAGRPDDAMELFDLAARIDLDDVTRTTGGGLHLATMGGLWQAVVHGFAGIRPTAEALEITPQLPGAWSRVVVRVRFRGVPVVIEITGDEVAVEAPETVTVRVEGQELTAPLRVQRRTRTEGAP